MLNDKFGFDLDGVGMPNIYIVTLKLIAWRLGAVANTTGATAHSTGNLNNQLLAVQGGNLESVMIFLFCFDNCAHFVTVR